MNKVIVTRHQGLIDYLIQEGIVDESTPVLAHASPEDVAGKHVYGVLPLELAAHAALVTTVTVRRDLNERINPAELTADDLRERGVTVATYKVEKVEG